MTNVRNFGRRRKRAPRESGTFGPAGPARSLVTNEILHPAPPPHSQPSDDGIWIVLGSESPSNTTGERIVKHFATLEEAHAAGFTWAV